MGSVCAVGVILLTGTPVVVGAAYLVGRRARKKTTLPWRPIFQLVDHRTRCLGQGRPQVERELGSLLGVPAWAWNELFALRRPLGTRPASPLQPRGHP